MNKPFTQQRRRVTWFMLILVLALMITGVGYASYVAPLQAKSELNGVSILVIEARQLRRTEKLPNHVVQSPIESNVNPVQTKPTNVLQALDPEVETEESPEMTPRTTVTEPPVDNSFVESDLSVAAKPPTLSDSNSDMTQSVNTEYNGHFEVRIESGQLSVGGQALVPGMIDYYELKLYNPSDKTLTLSSDISPLVIKGNRPLAFLETLTKNYLAYSILDSDLKIRSKATKTFILKLSVDPHMPDHFISQGQDVTVEGASFKVKLDFIINE